MNIHIHTLEKSKIIEIYSQTTTILLDTGATLEENEVMLVPKLKEQHEFKYADAIFLTRQNTDHATTLPAYISNLPIYSSKTTAQIALAAEKYKAKKPFLIEDYYKDCETITIGDISVTPVLVDTEEYDGYALIIESHNKTIVYTGDYKATARVDFEALMDKFPKDIDVLICHEGMIAKADINPISQRMLEESTMDLIAAHTGPVFVLQSPADIDKSNFIYDMALATKRVYLQDLYATQIAMSMDNLMPNSDTWSNVKTYLLTGYKPDHPRYKAFTKLPRVSKSDIEKEYFIMAVRGSMKKFFKTLSQSMSLKDCLLINTLTGDMAEDARDLVAFARNKSMPVHGARPSGHAQAKALKTLIERTNPRKIAPLSTSNVNWLRNECPRISVLTNEDIYC